MSSNRTPGSASDRPDRLLVGATASFVGVAVALLLVAALAIVSLELEDAVLSYVKAESLWSKAQKEAVIALEEYARTGDSAAWNRYRDALQVPLGDRAALRAIHREPPDVEQARQGFLQGGLEPGEVDGMIRLFRWFGDWAPMAESIEHWTVMDSLIADLQAEARQLRAQWLTPPPDAAAVDRTVGRIETLNADLEEREQRFTVTIDRANDVARRWSQRAIAGLTVLLLVAAGGLTWKIYRMIRDREESFRRSERRFRGLFEHNVAGVFRSTLDGTLLECNPAFAEIVGYESPDELEGIDVERLYSAEEEREDYLQRLRDERRLVNEELRIERRDGSVIWVLENSALTEDPETGQIVNEGTLVDITDRKRLEEGLRYQALHDPLTELANRTLLTDRVEQGLTRARRYERPMGLLMLDVDQFKRVNDRLGHVAGDQVLTELARRLEEAVREEDTVARWGGDEFAVVLPELAEPEAVEEVLGRIREAVRSPIPSRGESVQVNVSIGAVVRGDGSHPRVVGTDDPEELLRFASLALHWAKENAPGGFSLFDPDEEVEGASQIRRESELRRAVERGEIIAYYQPIVGLEDEARVGVEALARWRHPERGLVSPSEFIPMAEELDVIAPLQEAVIRQGCRDMAEWNVTNDAVGSLAIAFNVSGQQFRDPNLAETFKRLVEEEGYAPQQVIIEVTETSLMQVPATIDSLRNLGFQVFIDDFGTGYSTFTYLRELEVDGLKIDMSFVQGIVESDSDAALARTMVTLGERLGLTVIAEGIEAEAQAERLQSLGCTLGQGYLFSRPQPAEQSILG